MDIENLFTAKEAAEYLDRTRTYFFILKEKFGLEPVAQKGRATLYSRRDLDKVKKKLCAK